MLRSNIDLSSYTPIAGAPRWLCDLASIASNDLGVQALLGPSGINVSSESGKRSRATPDAVGIFLSGLAGRICTTRRRLAIGIPPAGRHLPLLFASSTVLANTLKRSLSRGTSTDGCVLVISPDLDLRSKYCDLFVQREALEAVYAGSRMRPNGERVALRQGVNVQRSQGVCFFLPGLTLPAKINFHPALILLDLRYSRWTNRASTLAKWVVSMGKDAGILALYSLGDSDTAYALSCAGFPDLPLDHSAINACSEQVLKPLSIHKELAVNWSLMEVPSYLNRKHEVIEVKSAETIEAIFTNIGTLIDEQKQKETPDLNRARWLLATLMHLPVPIICYERTARSLGRSTLRSLISKLGVQGRYNSEIGAVIQSLRMQFDQLYQTLNESNLRSQIIQTLLPDILNTVSSGQVLFMVRDNVMERAVQNWLEIEAFPNIEWLGRVVVKSCPNYYNIATNKYTAVLVNGIFPRRYRWIAGASLGTQVTFLAYPHEVDVIEHQLRSVYGDKVRTEMAVKRDRVLSQLCSRSVCPSTGSESKLPYLLQFKRPQQTSAKMALLEPEMGDSVEDISKLNKVVRLNNSAYEDMQEIIPVVELATWKQDVSDEESPDEDKDDIGVGDHEDVVSCVRLRVRSQILGEGTLWLAVDDIIDFVRATLPNDIQRATPQMLQPRDVLLLMNEGRRLNLFDQFVDLAEDQPEMHYIAVYRRIWREAIQKMVARYQDNGRLNYTTMLRSLQSAGATIHSEPAVRSWVQDQVIGPDNIASIIAVGRVSGVESLVNQAKTFDQIFRDIRSIRQGIGRRLNSAIRRHFKHFAERMPVTYKDTLDSRLGLPLEELLETIDLAEVITVGDHIEKIISYRVGRVHSIK